MATTTTSTSTTATADDGTADDVRLFQTTLRETISPYLPPPMVKAFKEIDPLLEPVVGPEASVNIAGSLFLAWFLYRLATALFSSSSSSVGSGSTKNTAIQEDDRDKDILPSNAETSRPFDETVVLCGPSLAGKTSAFYKLLDGSSDRKVGTVRSIKSNTGFLETTSGATLRILDTPGHWGASKLLRVVEPQDVQRLVVVVDSTQPVAPAADYLYAVLKSSIYTNSGSSPTVLVACHKSDHTKAKNARRLKLQLRSELVRLSKLESEGDGDWEETMNALPLCSSSVTDLKALREFCETGTPPSSTRKR
mmetsp:Transcript_7875/g.16231  ORF Transcript_7875/g.16231 Transcript_7875/m.16231 type:complete len:308 (+) Transcript_7875:68-991(+)